MNDSPLPQQLWIARSSSERDGALQWCHLCYICCWLGPARGAPAAVNSQCRSYVISRRHFSAVLPIFPLWHCFCILFRGVLCALGGGVAVGRGGCPFRRHTPLGTWPLCWLLPITKVMLPLHSSDQGSKQPGPKAFFNGPGLPRKQCWRRKWPKARTSLGKGNRGKSRQTGRLGPVLPDAPTKHSSEMPPEGNIRARSVS